jgi:hypothetical protein
MGFKGDGRSVLRGGYGIYYDQSFLNVPLFAVQQANPEIYATFLNDNPNLSIDSPAPSIPRPLNNRCRARAAECLIRTLNRRTRSSGMSATRRKSAEDMAVEFDLCSHPRPPRIHRSRHQPAHWTTNQRATQQRNPGRVLTTQFAAHAAE